MGRRERVMSGRWAAAARGRGEQPPVLGSLLTTSFAFPRISSSVDIRQSSALVASGAPSRQSGTPAFPPSEIRAGTCWKSGSITYCLGRLETHHLTNPGGARGGGVPGFLWAESCLASPALGSHMFAPF